MEYVPRQTVFNGPIVIIGFGGIGQGFLPLLFRHIDLPIKDVTVVSADDRGRDIAEEMGVRFIQQALDADNLRQTLAHLLQGRNGFIVNLSVNVSSVALVSLAREWGALYIDTCIEPWAGGYTDLAASPAQRSNYALREEAILMAGQYGKGPTALLAHGANPGLVSHFVKRALLHIARDTGVAATVPRERTGWALLAQKLGIKGIHIAERDTQRSARPKERMTFVNTWSVDGFIAEGLQPAELGWGTHEKSLPQGGHCHDFGCKVSIWLDRPGAAVRVRTWTPCEGPFVGFLITHNESISLADYLTVHDGDRVVYRPTCHYAYHPCDAAVLSLHELAGKGWDAPQAPVQIVDAIQDGHDELGVLLFGHQKNAYWYGSRLDIATARGLAPFQNATGLQVTAAVLAGVVWAIENPDAGILEAEALPHEHILSLAEPYLGIVEGVYTSWTPLNGRSRFFDECLDRDDPWQFRNVIVS
ncbi:homospermidine synthase [Haematospirillum jordaniae]|uniref:homospermidine synthase n=1 Tax=Haematospirillum jordaniae TaxID=1549855 RepID=UPI0014331289|nr:saccharopine dehydrogenase C-terminal domain-containing protein [Haematospirillum jordaniae]NKD84653.1 homospermidine synthase [Haematospirillum jordaniae]